MGAESQTQPPYYTNKSVKKATVHPKATENIDAIIDIIKNLVPSDTYSILMENAENGHIVSDLNVFEKQIAIMKLLRQQTIYDQIFS